MPIIRDITNRAFKSARNVTSGYKFTWWKTNFNMPISSNLFNYSNKSNWINGAGPFEYYDVGNNFDLSGFLPGYEVICMNSVFSYYGPVDAGQQFSVTQKFIRESDGYITRGPFTNHYTTDTQLPDSSSWSEWVSGWFNQGVAPREINASGWYRYEISFGGVLSGTYTNRIYFSNVPIMESFYTPGYIWIGGTNQDQLVFCNANSFKHVISGENLGFVGTEKNGHIWIGLDNRIHRVGNGYDYRTKWSIKQFGSAFSNGATGETLAGTTKTGNIWVDNEFGRTHIAFIGTDGYKRITGAGENPYI